MKTHELKTWPTYFEAVADGRKTFEARRDDRGYEIGDVLHLREWSPEPVRHVSTTNDEYVGTTAFRESISREPRGYTGRELRVEVTYIMRGPSRFGVEAGFVIMGFRRLP